MKRPDIKLDADEKKVENGPTYVPVPLKEKRRIEEIVRKAKKNRSISLRISDYDLGRLKEQAAREGVPYQTLINTVLHKYVTNQLHDDREVLHIVRSLKVGYGTGS